MHASHFSSRNLQLVWEVLDAFCRRYSPLDASCRRYCLRIRSDGWSCPLEGAGGGLRIYTSSLSCAFCIYSMTATIAVCLVVTLYSVIELEQWSLVYLHRYLEQLALSLECSASVQYTVFHPIIPALCRISSDYSRIMPAPWTCLFETTPA